MKERACKGVIFDMDGVLIDSHPVHKKVWAQFLASLDRPVTEKELDFVLDGRKREEILRHFLGDLSAQRIRDYGQRKDRIYEKITRELKTISGVEQFLGLLESAGIPMAVATSASFERARDTLEALGILPRFRALVTGNDVLKGKPDPEVFVRAAERLNRHPHDLLVVEDAVSGVRAAKSTGMKCLGIAADGRSGMLRAAGADHVVADYQNISLNEVHRLF
ncbi:MAG TPA: HAD family phosphatase [Terriglobia bacterium]|nr:HAD family phosphatase [Terriglobia bacterium]